MAETDESSGGRSARFTRAPDPGLEALLEYLNATRAFDFTGYKRATLARRIDKRMQQVGMDRHEDYIDFLSVHPEEFEQLFNTILINVTSFFRDQEMWDALGSIVVPDLIGREEIRVWSAGSASGQEAYSVVMLLAEAIGVEGVRERVKVYATDVDNDALEHARSAVYTSREVESVPEQLRAKYFDTTANRHAFSNDLRRAVIFGRHDLLVDAPISRVDLLLCRNTLMYFNADVQSQLVTRLHFALGDRGYLVLGKVEMLLGQSDLFEPVDVRQRIFRKVARTSLRTRLLAMAGGGAAPGYGAAAEEELLERAFEERSNAEILLDSRGNLVVANQRARSLFNIAFDSLGRPFQDLELSYRPVELRSWIEQARNERRAVQLDEVQRWSSTGELTHLTIEVTPLLTSDDQHLGVLITFTDVTRHRQIAEELEQTHRELEAAYEELQSSNEELQSSNEELETTNEELQSTIEELETTNEELQSTNEELETMNEELSSTNEELQAINDELRDRTGELNQVNAYMESILTSLHAAVIVVDRELCVRVWNGRSFDLWGLRPEEVEGRNLLSLDIGLPVDALAQPMRRCLNGQDGQVPDLIGLTRRGVRTHLRVQLSPLRGVQSEIEGVIALVEDRGPAD